MKKTNIVLFIISLLALSSCKIGLGSSIDLEAPIVSITSPDFMSKVKSGFILEGTAKDNEKVIGIEVQIAKKTWQFSGNTWKSKIEGEEWTVLSEEDAGCSVDSTGLINWWIKVELPNGTKNTEYVITVNVSDAMGNVSDNSIIQRTIFYDTTPPKVSITSPVVKYHAYNQIESALSGNDYKQFLYLSEYLNESITVEGYQDENNSLSSLQILLCNQDESIVYYDSGILTENLRNWTITIPKEEIKSNGEEITSKTFMQIVAISKDAANNECEIRSQGWICYWPEADIPWQELPSVGKTFSETENKKYYPGYKLQGQSYDDDGISKVDIYLYENIMGEYILCDSKSIKNISDKELQTYYAWSIPLPNKVGKKRINVKTTDVNGKTSQTSLGYFEIQDITFPAVEGVNTPLVNNSLFGDKNGDINFDFTVSDDTEVTEAKLLWLKDETKFATYLNAASNKWFEPTDSGNKMWDLNLSSATMNPETLRSEKHATITINLFDDLGISSENALVNNKFVVWVADGLKSDVDRKKTTGEFTYQGDIIVPTVSIDELYIVKVDNTEDKYVFPISGTLPKLGGGERIKLKGKWNDDSTQIWDISKINKVVVSWNGLQIDSSKIIMNPDGKTGTWETLPLEKDGLTSSVNVLIATLTDYGKNTGSSVPVSFNLVSEALGFEGIDSTNGSGTYTVGTKIEVYLKFNKAVTWDGDDPGVLTLNNGKKATYKSGKNTRNIVFEYPIDSGDDISKLEVTNFDEFSFVNTKSASEIVKVNINTSTPEVLKLGHNKSIEISTSKPVMESVNLSDTGDKLILTYNKNISKNNGIIKIEQTDVSAVPAILTETEYSNFTGANNYYTVGTNGCSSTGEADLSTKYILNYEKDTTDSAIIEWYKGQEGHIVTIDVASSSVSTSGNQVTVNLTGSYALPVKGGTYKVQIEEKAFADNVGNEVDAGSKTGLKMPGIETPVIRVKQSNPKFDSTSKTAEQPLVSEVKIDCETPNSIIYYTKNEKQFPIGLGENVNKNYPYSKVPSGCYLADPSEENYPPKGETPAFTAPTNSSTKYTAAFNVGTNEDEDWQWGAKYAVSAIAYVGTNKSAVTYNSVNKSVFVMYDNGGSTTQNGSGFTNGGTRRVWLRGGDNETGTNITSGLPFSWDESKPEEARLLTQGKIDNVTAWYFVTWSLPTTAYVKLLSGEVDENGVLIQTSRYWSKNAWTPFFRFYPMYSGESRVVKTGSYQHDHTGQLRGCFCFQDDTSTLASNKDGSSGGGSSDEDSYRAKWTITETDKITVNTNLLSSPVVMDDANDRIALPKYEAVAQNYIILIEAEKLDSNIEKPNVELEYFNYGKYTSLGKTGAQGTGTLKYAITINKDIENAWKYNNYLYLSAEKLKITSIKIINPILKVTSNQGGNDYKANTWKLTVKYKKNNSVSVDNYYVQIGNCWEVQNLYEKKVVTNPSSNEETLIFDMDESYGSAQWGGLIVYGYGLEITSAVLAPPPGN